MSKPFDPELHAKFDRKARDLGIEVVKSYVSDVVDGDIYVTNNPDEIGPDLMVWKDRELLGFAEVEVKTGWRSGRFPFDNVHFPERKGKYIRDYDPILFVMFSNNMKMCLIVEGEDVGKSPLEECSNKYQEDELFYAVPLNKVQLFSIGR